MSLLLAWRRVGNLQRMPKQKWAISGFACFPTRIVTSRSPCLKHLLLFEKLRVLQPGIHFPLIGTLHVMPDATTRNQFYLIHFTSAD